MKKKTISAAELDAKFDAGEDISEYLDWENARRPGLEARRVNVDFPDWMVCSLDREAARIGVPRQALIKFWIAERLSQLRGCVQEQVPAEDRDGMAARSGVLNRHMLSDRVAESPAVLPK